MTHLRVSEAAALVGVSDDTLRRWIKYDEIETSVDDGGRILIAGEDLAEYAVRLAATPDLGSVLRSARNQFVGIVTAVKTDGVMAQVDMQCGRLRVVSLMSSEAVHELGLEVGTVATAVVKATDVIIETTTGGKI
jgi:molybdopterin-binding protein